jgi:hypothetical protein
MTREEIFIKKSFNPFLSQENPGGTHPPDEAHGEKF